jgi:L-fuculose-phosphate aldolase
MDFHLLKELQQVAHSMFSKNYFGVFHGSISAKTDLNSFIINRKNTILDEVDQNDFIRLATNTKKDYRWKEASPDSDIHLEIYNALPSAKYISYTMPPYTTAYSFEHSVVIPQDYYGYKNFKEIPVYDPENFNDWEERAPYEISTYFQNSKSHLLLIKGFGLLSYDRDLLEMVKKVAILENSCRLLSITNIHK